MVILNSLNQSYSPIFLEGPVLTPCPKIAMAYQGCSFHDDFARILMRETQITWPSASCRPVDMESIGKPAILLMLIMLNGYVGD